MIQSRYGWTDEVVNSLRFSRFLQLQKLLVEAKIDEAKDRLILAAFVGFQMGAAGKMTYGDYLDHLGLSDRSLKRDGSRSDVEMDARLMRMGVVPKDMKKRR